MSEYPKLTVYNPNVAPNPRDLASASTPEFAAEEQATELALRMACEDPTEREHLSAVTTRARGRVRAAAGELVRSILALMFAFVARVLLNRSRKKLYAERGNVGSAELGALALQRLLAKFHVRRLIGRANMLRMLGANSRTDDEANSIHSMALAERSYRPGDGFGVEGHAVAADTPVVRVLLGIRVVANGEPVWCLKRFASTGTGGWRQIHSGYREDAQSILIDFYTEPSHEASRTGELARPHKEVPPSPKAV